MKITQIGAFAATVASLTTFTYGYLFSDVSTTTEAEKENTDLTKNEVRRIFGGTEANIDDYPFLASLRIELLDETFCAGTLIAPQYILTAGHCILDLPLGVVATFGTNVSAGTDSGDAVAVPVIESFRHPLYRKKQHLYDVGLLKLKKPIKRKMAKLCPADGSSNKVGTMATVAGWGKTEDSGSLSSPILEQLTLPVISNAECGKFKRYVGRITEGMLCAGTGKGHDTCNGDSGSPLIVDDDIIIGCVSWGSKCGQQPGIYTRLTYVMDYIEDILAGGDGSKFQVASSLDSTSGSTDESPVHKVSGSNDMSWLFKLLSSDLGSGGDASKGKATKGSLVEDDSESGSDDLSWLFASDSDSGSEDMAMVKGGKATKASIVEDDSESGSDDVSWLFASESDSGSEDTVLVKGDKATKATKTSKATKALEIPIEEDSASTSASTSGSEDSANQSELVDQSEQVTQESV